MADAAVPQGTIEAVRPSPFHRPAAVLALLAGAVAIAVAVLADYQAGLIAAGFGLLQAIVAAGGCALLVLGWDTWHGRWAEWRASLAALLAAPVKLAVVGAQLALTVAVVRWFQIENPAFARLLVPFVAVGFAIHHALPLPRRLPYFVALSLIGFVMVLGWLNAAWVAGLSLLMVALCHLPLPWAGRVGALLAGGAALGVLRVKPDWTPFSNAVWPVLGSILMFRLIVYAYDVRNSKDKIPAKWSLAYFFMAPNVVFPLFPVVDFATFRRTYYDREPFAIYQRGLDWVFRGLLHLLLYRAVYQHLTLGAAEVTSGAQLVRYMVATFLLYLRVSGTFHLIVGMLHLFGFRLPETHRFFYLASSFTDLWRRINIYWKDFMMKLVFYPVYFPLRKRGETTALIMGTLAVFLVTWLTHSYQWFWILGRWLLSWTDGLFWAILGLLLLANSVWEAKRGRKRALPGAARRRVRDALAVALQAATVFTIICTLWSLWDSPTLGDWFDLLSVERFGPKDWAAVLGVLGTIAVAAFIGELTGKSQGDVDRGAAADQKRFGSAALATTAGLALMASLALPAVTGPLGFEAQVFVRDLRMPDLNKRDAATLQRGYYENLQGVSLQNSQLWELYAQRPVAGQSVWHAGVLRERDDYLWRDMRPLFAVMDRGMSFRTNRWGMRDRDYTRDKPAGTWRLALLGQSYVAGDGVADGQTFDEVVEDRLAAEHAGSRIEILNFGIGSYSLLQQWLLLDDRVWTFQPDVVGLVANPWDGDRMGLHLYQQLRRGMTPPWPEVQEVLERSGVTADMRETEALSRLAPFGDTLVHFAERGIAAAGRRQGVPVVWIYLATPEREVSPEARQARVNQARAEGFHVLDWSDVYRGHPLETIQASSWDKHPNALGHRLIAERLYQALTADTAVGAPLPRPGRDSTATRDHQP